MKKKKILIITNHSYMLWQFRKELISEMMKENEVVLSMPFVGHEDDFKNLGLKCINTEIDRRGINPKTDLKLLKTYFAMLKEEKPDLVVTYSIKPNVYAGIACGMLKIPFSANVQGLGSAFQKPALAKIATMMYTFAFRKVDTVFFENVGNANEFINRKIITKDKITLLNGAGINLDQYEYKPYTNNDKVHFLYLGRIMKEKGMDELLEAVSLLKEDQEDFILDMVGFFEDEYKDRIETLEKEGIVKFHGFQENPKPFYEACDCVVLPSYHEGMSNVLLEGAATGRVLITSDIHGCKEAVEDGVTGYLVEVKNINALYNAMKKVLHMSCKERIDMGVQARNKMEKEFRKEKVVEDTMKALKLKK